MIVLIVSNSWRSLQRVQMGHTTRVKCVESPWNWGKCPNPIKATSLIGDMADDAADLPGLVMKLDRFRARGLSDANDEFLGVSRYRMAAGYRSGPAAVEAVAFAPAMRPNTAPLVSPLPPG